MSQEISELKGIVEKTNRDVSRILNFIEGDLGNPSVKTLIDTNTNEVRATRKMVHENREQLNAHTVRLEDAETDIKNMKKASGIVGAGSGGIMATAIEIIRSVFS